MDNCCNGGLESRTDNPPFGKIVFFILIMYAVTRSTYEYVVKLSIYEIYLQNPYPKSAIKSKRKHLQTSRVDQ